MASILHRIEAIGNLTRTPELRYLASGAGALTCSVAVNDNYTKDGQEVEEVQFYDVEFYGDMSEKVNARGYQKGDRVFFEGQPKTELYDKKDGSGQGFRNKVKFGRVTKFGGRTGAGDYKAAEVVENVPKKVDKDDVVF